MFLLDVDYPPVAQSENMFQYVLGLLGQAFAFLKYRVPDFFFHSENGYFGILLAIFIIGTIINLITGDDDDIVDD